MRTGLLMATAGMLAVTSITGSLHADTFNLYGGSSISVISEVPTSLQFLNPGSACSGANGHGYCGNVDYSQSFPGSGSLDILNNSSSTPIVGLVIQATFNSANISNFSGGNDWIGTMGGSNFDVSSAGSGGNYLQGPTSTRDGNSGIGISNEFSNGYYVYFYINLANFESSSYDVSGYSGVNSSGQLVEGDAVAIPYSFITLPASVVFNVYGVQTCNSQGTCLEVSTTNPNSSTYGIGECLSCPADVPEPTTLLLLVSGLTGMILRRRRSA